METREFVEIRTRRYMAQALEEFEDRIERPLSELAQRDGASAEICAVVEGMPRVKATFRKKLQALASDCLDLMPSDLQINGYEPVRR